MKFFKQTSNIIFTCIIFVLVGALLASVAVIKKKDSYIASVKAQIEENQSKIEEADGKIAEFEAQIAEKEKANADMQSQLKSAQDAKKKLEDENAELKKKIATLSAEKAKQEAITAVSPQATAPDGRRVCYLTFDDGPSANTLKILEILNRYRIKATFFVTGEFCDKYPEDVKKFHEAGHSVQNHSDKHPHVKGMNINDLIADTKECSRKIKMLTGEEPTLYRAPYGEYDDTVMTTVEGMGLKVIQWSAEVSDRVGKDLSTHLL